MHPTVEDGFYTYFSSYTPYQTPYAISPLTYNEQLGAQVTISVQVDSGPVQTFDVYNNAPGVWVTFPILNANSTVKITIFGDYGTVSAVMFDPYDSHRTTYNYYTTSPNTTDIQSVTDPLGNTTTFTYTTVTPIPHAQGFANGPPAGLLTSVTDPLGNTTEFVYEFNPPGTNGTVYLNLTTIDPLGNKSLSVYDMNTNLISFTDPNGNTTTYAYDAKNRLISLTDALGNQTQFEYDANGNLVQVTDPNGNITKLVYTTCNRLSKIVSAHGTPICQITQFGWDASGNLVSIIDPRGNETTFTYDASERLTQVTLPDGNLITSAFDALDRLRAITTQNGNQSNTSLINVTNAANWLQNAGAENADLFTVTSPRYWSSAWSGAHWDTSGSHAHSGQSSLELASLNTGSPTNPYPHWSQLNLPIPPGTQALLQVWAQSDGVNTNTAWVGVLPYNLAATASETDSSTTTLPMSTAWSQVPTDPFAFSIPGDSQYGRFPLSEVRAYAKSGATSPSTGSVWFDDFTLYAVSLAFNYYGENQIRETVAPDGGRPQLVYDRYGRPFQSIDARGQTTTLTYDSLDRVTQITDPLGNTVQYAFNAVGLLSSFIDANGNTTEYSYDPLYRLTTITYPDSSTEQFSYDAGSRLASYTNNLGQKRTFLYDAANRLLQITYSVGTTALFRYDNNSNCIYRVDRNGDISQYVYDALNRLIAEERLSQTPTITSWLQSHTLDENNNETQFACDATGPVWDTATYDETSDYSVASTQWTIPSPGYDDMNRPPAYEDANSNETTFSYDVESRVTDIGYPNGSPAIATAATYDVMSRLMSLNTGEGSTSLLSLDYGYDLASNRTSMLVGSDTIDYRLDASGRLVEEATNTLDEMSFDRFAAGTLSQIDTTSGALAMLAFNDSLTGSFLDLDRWRMAYGPSGIGFVGLEIRPSANGVNFAFPRGYCNLKVGDANWDNFGFVSNCWGALEHRTPLSTSGFDVTVNFANFQGQPSGGEELIGLQVTQGHLETATASVLIGYDQDNFFYSVNGGSRTYLSGSPVTSGTLRIQLTGGTINLYNATSGSALWSFSSPFSSGNLYVSLYFQTENGVCSATLSDFGFTSSSVVYPPSATYTSTVYDSGRSGASWETIAWNANVPSGTSLEFYVAASNSSTGPWTYNGPYTSSGTSLSGISGRYARYQAVLTTDSTSTYTPTVSGAQIFYGGTSASQLVQNVFDPNGNLVSRSTLTPSSGTGTDLRNNWVVGTITSGSSTISGVSASYLSELSTGETILHPAFPSGTTISSISMGTNSFTVSNSATMSASSQFIGFTTASWLLADLLNNLNQIMRQDITPAGGSLTTWRYSYDNNGNRTAKFNGSRGAPTNQTSYAWDEENRLTQVTLPSGVTISFTYDLYGRMLTRTHSVNGTWTFEWDGMSMVRETDPSGNVTNYYVVNGVLMSFARTVSGTTSTYQVHSDALGHVRAVTNSAGSVVFSATYDSWGNQLSVSDTVPNGGLMYRFLGAWGGVRWDPDTGLYYVRARWYAPDLQRFISRDVLRGINRYAYAVNNPTTCVDPTGLAATVFYTDINGTQQVYSTTSGSGLYNFLNSPAVGPGSVTAITIEGHGVLHSVSLDPGSEDTASHILVNNGRIEIQDDTVVEPVPGSLNPNARQNYKRDLGRLLKVVLANNAQINIHACHTGQKGGLAYQLARIIPGRTVVGYTNEFVSDTNPWTGTTTDTYLYGTKRVEYQAIGAGFINIQSTYVYPYVQTGPYPTSVPGSRPPPYDAGRSLRQ